MKIRFRLWTHYQDQQGNCNLELYITHKGKSKTISTGVKCRPSEWDPVDQKLRSSFPMAKKINLNLWNLRLKYEQAGLQVVMQGKGIPELLQLVNGSRDHRDFIAFGKEEAARLKDMGRDGNAYTYAQVIRQFEKAYPAIGFDQITPQLLKDWRDAKLATTMGASGINNYLRTLRAIWNRSGTELPSPFVSGLMLPQRSRLPRNNDAQEIRALFAYQVPEKNTGMQLAKDIWCLGFLFRGMDFVDLVHLKAEDLQGRYFDYRRKKTDEELRVRIYPEARQIVERYASRGYLFPILQVNQSYQQTKNHLSRMNRALRLLSNEIRSSVRFTTKTCRYSFASLAKELGVEHSVIREMLGHKDRSVTALYLDRHPQRVIDEAHMKIINYLLL